MTKQVEAVKRLALSLETLDAIASACARDATPDGSTAALSTLPPDVIGEEDLSALVQAVQDELNQIGHHDLTVMSWHILRSKHLPIAHVHVRDIAVVQATQVVCVIVCIEGDGQIWMTNPTSTDKPTAGMTLIEVLPGSCIVYGCNRTYAVSQSAATYLHCVCASTSPSVFVHQPIRYPCPYNRASEFGDVRVYPASYDPTVTIDCAYRGVLWKNVLDHLKNCKAHPETSTTVASREKRRARNNVLIKCVWCSHPPFEKKNSYIQHKRRKHSQQSEPPTSINMELVERQVPANPAPVAAEGEEGSDGLEWLSIPGFDYDDVIATTTKKQSKNQSHLEASIRSEQEDHAGPGMCFAGSVPEDTIRLEESTPCMITVNGARALPGAACCDTCALEPLTENDASEAVRLMLETITMADIRQPAGRMGHNAGEITIVGVTALLAAFGDLQHGDVFADIGAGVGNVSIQVALQSRFAKAVCIEMRPELTELTSQIVAKHIHAEPRLGKVSITTVDIAQVDLVDFEAIADVTHAFSHNTVFEPRAMLKFEDICFLPKLRRIALTRPPCSRHRERCFNPFCQAWTLESTIRVPVAFKNSLVEVFTFVKSEHL